MNLSLWLQKYYRRIVSCTLQLVLILLVAFGLAKAQDFYRAAGRDFFSFWLGSHMLVNGESPYNPNAWRTGHEYYGGMETASAINRAYLYPLPLAVFLAPLGYISLEMAAVLSTSATILVIILSLQLMRKFGNAPIELKYILPTAAGIFLFRPVVVTLYLGQIDVILAFVILISLLFWQKKKWFLGGFILAFTALKPQTGVPLLVFVSIWLFFRLKRQAIFGIGTSLMMLYLIGIIFDFQWIQHWLASSNDKVGTKMWSTPTVWGFTNWVCKFNENCSITISVIALLLLSIGLIIALFRIKEDKPHIAVGLIIPIILIITPYLWVYSQSILLLPLLLIWQKLLNFEVPYLLKASFFILIDLFAISLVSVSMSIGADVITILVPAVTIGIFVFIGQAEARLKKYAPS